MNPTTDEESWKAEEVRLPLAYRVSALAAELDCSIQTVYREIDEGRLRAKKIRGCLMVPRAEVDRWLSVEEI